MLTKLLSVRYRAPPQAGLYKPHWQLRPPSQPLPPSLRAMLDVLIQPQLTQLVAFIIQVRRWA